MLKICTKCKVEKLLEDFSKDKTRKDGVGSWCKACKRVVSKQYYQNGRKEKDHRRKNSWGKTQKGKIASRRSGLKRKYDITSLQYQMLFSRQRGLCAICNRPEIVKQNNQVKRLAVDHNHKTDIIRGLLCQNCNIALGHIEKNLNLLPKMIEYLSSSPRISERRQSIIDAASAKLRSHK